jgi:hypothetical protein
MKNVIGLAQPVGVVLANLAQMRTPRPGPDNEWRYTISRGSPSSTPDFRHP